MNLNTKWAISLFFCIVLTCSWDLSVADRDDHKEKGRYPGILDRDDDDDEEEHHRRQRYRKRHRDHEYEDGFLKQINNPTYKKECGECHFTYQPELLPSASWMKILGRLDDHFGEEIELAPKSKEIISQYLKLNGAENSRADRAVKIMRSLGAQVPGRITDVPYIRKKHHELNPNILKRESIGSLSNCIACHKTAEQGVYDEDHVKIPK
jgi:hypothetical protein